MVFLTWSARVRVCVSLQAVQEQEGSAEVDAVPVDPEKAARTEVTAITATVVTRELWRARVGEATPTGLGESYGGDRESHSRPRRRRRTICELAHL